MACAWRTGPSQLGCGVGLAGSDREFPWFTARSGTQRARVYVVEHLIRRSGQTVQGYPVVAVRWPDVPGPSFCVGSCWLWPSLQSRGCPQPERRTSTALAARGAAVQIRSRWTNVLDRSPAYRTTQRWTATQTATLRSVAGSDISSAVRDGRFVCLAGAQTAPGADSVPGNDCRLLTGPVADRDPADPATRKHDPAS